MSNGGATSAGECLVDPIQQDGFFLAESSSKADEYARDDKSGEYAGLYAVLICRAVLGRPFVTEQPGNYAGKVTSGEYDVVIGDREKAVGTFREFIFFHEASVYPEYAAFYRRERSATQPPSIAPVQQSMTPQVIGQQEGCAIVFITQGDETKKIVFRKAPFGLTFTPNKTPIVVDDVTEGQHGQELGVQPGWTLKTVGDRSCDGLTYKEIFGLLQVGAKSLKK